MERVQDKFKEILKSAIAPKLRECGLKGSGQNYSIKSDSHYALVGIQKSVYSDSQKLEFTINLYVISKNQWEAERIERSYLPNKPSANVRWPIGWVKRIGHLMPGKRDYWWSLNSNTDIPNLIEEVLDAVCNKAVPAMPEQIKNV